MSCTAPLSRLQEMRSWREGLGPEFGASELAAAIRVLYSGSGPSQEAAVKAGREAYLRELVELAANGSVPLDGKAGACHVPRARPPPAALRRMLFWACCWRTARGPPVACRGLRSPQLAAVRPHCAPRAFPAVAAYLLWGPAKAKWGAHDPDVRRMVPLALQHIGTMRVRSWQAWPAHVALRSQLASAWPRGRPLIHSTLATPICSRTICPRWCGPWACWECGQARRRRSSCGTGAPWVCSLAGRLLLPAALRRA